MLGALSLEKQIERVLCLCVNHQRKKPVKQARAMGIGWELTERAKCIPFSLDQRERLKHLYILGSTGSGKTNVLTQLIEEDIRQGRTTVVIDMRGDLVDRVLASVA